MDRLSPLDAEFLHLEDDCTHLHIAGVCTFEGPPPPFADLLASVGAKIHLIPRYRQRVRGVPFELGRPVWVDDPHFRLDYHLRHTALPAPGDDAAVRSLVGRLTSQRLDRDRPLWEVWMVEGLEGGRWALVAKVHHCMVDGISGVDLLTILLDLEPDSPLPEAPPWSPTPEPAAPLKVLDAWAGLAHDVATRAAGLPSALRDPAGSVKGLVELVQGGLQFTRELGTTPLTSIEGRIGPHRAWAHSSATIDDIRTIRKAFGGTLNDVVMTAITGAYRDLLLHRQDDLDRAVVRTLVPVSVRREDGKGVPDNRVSAMIVDMPVQVADPVERLAVMQGLMADTKGSHMAEMGEAVTGLADLAPPMVMGTGSRLAMRALKEVPQRSVTTVTTNVPGPQFPLYSLGRRMLDWWPFVPITQGVRVGTAIVSYDGVLGFGVTSDYDTVPDPGRVADAIAADIDTLRERAEQA